MMRMLLHPLRGWLEQMAMADMGWEVFLRLTQVSGTAQAGVPCQLRCIEDRCLSVRSSLTPRSVSSGPQAVVILILPAGPEIKRNTEHAFANLRITCRFWVTDANADSAYRDTNILSHSHHHFHRHTCTNTHKPIYPHACKIIAV